MASEKVGMIRKKKMPIEVKTAKRAKLNPDLTENIKADEMKRLVSNLDSDTKVPNASLQKKYDELSKLLLESKNIDSDIVEHITSLVLNSQRGRQIYQLLSPSASTSRIRSVLRLLATCATASTASARCIVQRLNFSRGQLPQIAVIKSLMTEDGEDVRSAFVTFVLALIVGQEWLHVRSIVDNNAPILLVIHHLHTDRSSLIVLVLSSLKSALLENAAVSKKEKLKLFNARNMSSILSLYEWRGQKLTWNFSRKYQKKMKRTKLVSGDADAIDSVDSEELDMVRQCVHEFLQVLFTSYKHGIVFRHIWCQSADTTNPVLLNLLKMVSAPWEDELKLQLVVKTLSACPALCNAYYSSFNESLTGSDTSEWLNRMRFFRGVVSGLDLSLYFGDDGGKAAECLPVSNMTIEQFCQAIINCLYPVCARQSCLSSLGHAGFEVRQSCLSLIVSALDQVRNIREQLVAAEHSRAAEALAKEVVSLLPSCQQLLLLVDNMASLPQSLCAVDEEHEPNANNLLIDILILCARVVVECVSLSPNWCGSTSIVSSILVVANQWQSHFKIADLKINVENILASLVNENMHVANSYISSIGQCVDKMISDITDTLPSTACEIESISQNPASRVSLSLKQYVYECDDALRSDPIKKEVLKSWTERDVSLLVGAALETNSDQSLEPNSWSSFIQSLINQSIEAPGVGILVLPHLFAMCRMFICQHNRTAGKLGGGKVTPTGVNGVLTAETVIKWIMGHNMFIDRLLETNTEDEDDEIWPCTASLKTNILRIILALVTQCHHLCKSSHVALFLCAYDGSLSFCDTLIHQLIYHYQREAGLSLAEYVPTIWSSSALSFYTPVTDGGCSIAHTRPSYADVFALLDPARLELTCRYLSPNLRTPATHEMSSASANTSSTAVAINKRDIDDRVYDVRFVLSLLVQLTGPEQPPFDTASLLERGIGSLLVCLLACRQKLIRMATCVVLSRLHTQLSILCHHEKQSQSPHKRTRRPRSVLWLTVIDLIRATFLYDNTTIVKSGRVKRLPFVVAFTWSRILNVLCDPSHRLFRVMCRYVLQCVSTGIRPNRVPLFFELFNSRSPSDHHYHREWVLETISLAMRDTLDYRTLCHTASYKLIMTQLGCRTLSATNSERVRLLQVIESSVRVPRVLWRLDSRHSVINWLSLHISDLCESGVSVRGVVCSLLLTIVDSISTLMCDKRVTSAQVPLSALCLATETLITRAMSCSANVGSSADLSELLCRLRSLMAA